VDNGRRLELQPAAAGTATAGQTKGTRHDKADRSERSKHLDRRLRVGGEHQADHEGGKAQDELEPPRQARR
jgi:hypothetical protein